jgi:hypothetical protein
VYATHTLSSSIADLGHQAMADVAPYSWPVASYAGAFQAHKASHWCGAVITLALFWLRLRIAKEREAHRYGGARSNAHCSDAGSVIVASYDAVGCRAPADGAVAGSRLEALVAQQRGTRGGRTRTRPCQAAGGAQGGGGPASSGRGPSSSGGGLWPSAVGHGRGRGAARSCRDAAGRCCTRESGRAAADRGRAAPGVAVGSGRARGADGCGSGKKVRSRIGWWR